MNMNLRVLIFEDVPDCAKEIENELRNAEIDFTSAVVDKKEDFTGKLKVFAPDIVVSCCTLPDFTGVEALALARELAPEASFIIVTGSMDEETAVECIKAGADDYLAKKHMARIGPAVRNAMKSRALAREKQIIETALRDNEKLYRSLVESAEDFIYVIDRDMVVKYLNPAGSRLFNAEPEAFVDKRLSEIYPKKTYEYERHQLLKVFKKGEKVYVENEFDFPAGHRWFSSLLVPVRDDSGTINMALGISRDITGRKAAEGALRGSEDRYRTLFESSPDAVVLVGMDGNFKDVNDAAVKLTGYSKEELTGKPFWEFKIYKDEYLPEILSVFSNLVKTGEVVTDYELELVRKNGDKRTVETNNAAIKTGDGTTCLQVIIRDVTERRTAEKALRESETKFRVLFDTSPDSVILFDARGYVLDCNRTWLEQSGYAREEFVGRHFTELHEMVAPEDMPMLIEQFAALSQGADNLTIEHKALDKRGNTHWYETRVSPVQMDKATLCFQTISHDITGRKQAEAEKETLQQQLLLSQKMEAIGTLAGGIAHDFNNMLTIILGNAQMNLMDLAAGDPSREAFSEIVEAAERAKDLTMKLLTFARREKVSVCDIPVNDVLKELVSMLKRSLPKKIVIRTKFQAALPPVRVDVNQMHQVFLNICNNGADAMPDGGTLTIESSTCALDDEYARTHVDAIPGTYCLVQISDTGIGIPHSIIDKIFEPFFTTKGVGKGTGLGLSTSYGIVKNHGGHIHAYSEVDRGAVIKVYLPFAEAGADSNGGPVPSERPQPGNETILVVDDEQAVLKLAEKVLKRAGYKVLPADGGRKGVELYKKHRKEISLVILDMIMPEMDGRDVYRALKKLNPDVRVMLSSGYSINGQAGDLIREGIHGFVQKPFNIVELCGAVRKALDG